MPRATACLGKTRTARVFPIHYPFGTNATPETLCDGCDVATLPECPLHLTITHVKTRTKKGTRLSAILARALRMEKETFTGRSQDCKICFTFFVENIEGIVER
jgi:hypothetical protein